MVSAISHTAESRRILDRAEEALALDEVPEAAALIWDSAACAMRSIAETRGWRIEIEYDLVNAAFTLARETGVDDISTLVQVVSTAPWLIEEGWIDKNWLVRDIQMVKDLLKILDSLDIE